MNALVGLALLSLIYGTCTVTAVTRREVCTTNSDCTTTSCSTGSTVICQHPAEGGINEDGGLCTCASTSGGCTTRPDCLGDSVNLNCPDSERHCYDNVCICDRFPGGK